MTPDLGKLTIAIVLALSLAACGNKKDLRPKAGVSLPVRPYGASVTPTSSDLLQLTPEAAPERSVEPRSDSEERQDDPFDLPPKG